MPSVPLPPPDTSTGRAVEVLPDATRKRAVIVEQGTGEILAECPTDGLLVSFSPTDCWWLPTGWQNRFMPISKDILAVERWIEYAIAMVRSCKNDRTNRAATYCRDLVSDTFLLLDLNEPAGSLNIDGCRKALLRAQKSKEAFWRVKCRLAAFASVLKSAEYKEAEEAFNAEWEKKYGEPFPETVEDFMREARRAGVSSERILEGNWKPADFEPIIAGYLQNLADRKQPVESTTESKLSKPTSGKETASSEPGGEPGDLLGLVRQSMKGKQRRVVELVIEAGGNCELSRIALDAEIDWKAPYEDAWESCRQAVNKKLKPYGYKLERHANSAKLHPLKDRQK